MDHADIRIADDLDGLPPWCEPAWLAAAEAWISESCEAAGLARTGPGTLRGRMWSRMFPCFRRSVEPWKSVAFWVGNIGCEDPVTVGLA